VLCHHGIPDYDSLGAGIKWLSAGAGTITATARGTTVTVTGVSQMISPSPWTGIGRRVAMVTLCLASK
jgi:hypothetical protein